jgi:hypothetical protein
MVHECQHIYETGRKCRRIPKRGQDLCPGHRPGPSRSHHDDPDFARQLLGYIQQLHGLSLEALFCALQDDLALIQPIVQRKSSRARYAPFARAFVAVTVAIEQLGNLRSVASHPSRPAGLSTPDSPFRSHQAASNHTASYASPRQSREFK